MTSYLPKLTALHALFERGERVNDLIRGALLYGVQAVWVLLQPEPECRVGEDRVSIRMHCINAPVVLPFCLIRSS